MMIFFIYLFTHFVGNSSTDQTSWTVFALDGSNNADLHKDVPL